MLPKVGIFGTNSLAAAVIRELQALSFEVMGLWDPQLGVAAAWCEHFAIPLPTDALEGLLHNQEVDLVVVCAPAFFHREIVTKALAAGKHVVCEPPLGITCADNAAIMQQALYYPSLLTVSTFGLRHIPAFRNVRNILESGQIGALETVQISVHCGPTASLSHLPYDWTCIGRLLAGPLFTLVGQLVDLLSFLCRRRATSVCGSVRRFQRDPPHWQYDQHVTREDFVSWQMRLEDGLPCSGLVDANQPGVFDLRLSISGREGVVLVENGMVFVQKAPDFKRNAVDTVSLGKETVQQEDMVNTHAFDYRHPAWVVAGVRELCRVLGRAFAQSAERRCFAADELQHALVGGFGDAQYARSVCDAIRQSHANRRWTEVAIPLRTPDNAATVLVPLKHAPASSQPEASTAHKP